MLTRDCASSSLLKKSLYVGFPFILIGLAYLAVGRRILSKFDNQLEKAFAHVGCSMGCSVLFCPARETIVYSMLHSLDIWLYNL